MAFLAVEIVREMATYSVMSTTFIPKFANESSVTSVNFSQVAYNSCSLEITLFTETTIVSCDCLKVVCEQFWQHLPVYSTSLVGTENS